ncbi:MAG: putative metal-binding motif-containing protein, partial [Myxococcales bacterium]|nr:putative metal-binding motif-containing protein [Myxococcales bacterium]
MTHILLRAPALLTLLLLLPPTTSEAHPFADVVTSASRSLNPARACDYDRDGAVRNDRYCRCNDQSRAGPGNYDRRGSREFCACDPSIQHCDPDGEYSDGTPRFRWTIDCNDFDPNAYPQHCAPVDCNANYQQHPHCAGAGDVDGDGFSGVDDCDEGDPSVHVGATDVCGDGVDQDCDGADARCQATDADGDGAVAEADGGDDCDDSDPTVHPGATDRCGDGVDSDCDGADPVCAADRDRDGFDDAAAGGDDCDDLNSARHPGAAEIPDDGIDQDCDGADATAADLDRDGDGFAREDDCDDGDPAVHP